MKIRHKYRAKPINVDNIRYDSKLEAKYAFKLQMLQKSGELLFYLHQVPIRLPGGTKYVVDFVEFWAPREGEDAGNVRFVDCKGYATDSFKIKKREVEAIYPFEIEVVKHV